MRVCFSACFPFTVITSHPLHLTQNNILPISVVKKECSVLFCLWPFNFCSLDASTSPKASYIWEDRCVMIQHPQTHCCKNTTGAAIHLHLCVESPWIALDSTNNFAVACVRVVGFVFTFHFFDGLKCPSHLCLFFLNQIDDPVHLAFRVRITYLPSRTCF